MKNEKKRIVVMGGSFNPPTVAHFQLMQVAINVLDAWRGFFVPVSDAYLRRKMRGCHPPVVLSPEVRVRMLWAMCTDDRMRVCEKEIGTVEARTMPTLVELQAEYPDAELYFLLGSDKLELLRLLTRKWGFLDLFKVALFARDEESIADVLAADDVLSPHLHRIVLLPQPAGTDIVSSSWVRERMLAGEPCAELLCTDVWKLFREFRPDDFPDTIERFKGDYEFLSNRFACPFVWEGLQYENAEAAFQSSRCSDERERKAFCRCAADKAAMKGREILPPAGWENERLAIMTSILSAKFQQNPPLMQRLKATGNLLLINGNSKGETFWGVDLYTWLGENNLGKILMKIRNENHEIYHRNIERNGSEA